MALTVYGYEKRVKSLFNVTISCLHTSFSSGLRACHFWASRVTTSLALPRSVSCFASRRCSMLNIKYADFGSLGIPGGLGFRLLFLDGPWNCSRYCGRRSSPPAMTIRWWAALTHPCEMSWMASFYGCVWDTWHNLWMQSNLPCC